MRRPLPPAGSKGRPRGDLRSAPDGQTRKLHMAEQRPDRPQRKGTRPGGPGNGAIRFRGLFGWVLFIGLAVMLFMLLSKQGSTFKTIPFNEFMNILEPGTGANPAAIAGAAPRPGSAPGATQP